MFGRQASSLSRTGTLLVLMVAIVGVRLTWSASMESDGADKLVNLNPSIFDSFGPLGMHLGGTTEKSGNGSVTMAPVNLTCGLHHESEFDECMKKNVIKVDDINKVLEVGCKNGAALFTCGIKVVCKYCSGDDLEKIKEVTELEIKDATEHLCKKWASSFPSFSCTNWTLIIIIIAVVVLVALGILGVMVFCCCMGGKGGHRHGSRKSKHSSKRSSKSKLRKGSSKRRGSSRH